MLSTVIEMGRAGDVEIRVVRVFVRDGQGGNHLGIRQGLLADADMQALAATLGYAETIFLGEGDADGIVPVRIFTPTSELPFAGHPLVGAAWHLSQPGAAVQLRCGAGVVVGQRHDPGAASVDVDGAPTVAPLDSITVEGVVSAWLVRLPLPYEVIELAGPGAVASYRLDDRPEHRLVWARGEGGRDDVVRSRFFAAGLGVVEDAATGSAAVALAAVLRREGAPTGALTVHQGVEVGSPSRIELRWGPRVTTIGGHVLDDGVRTIDA